MACEIFSNGHLYSKTIENKIKNPQDKTECVNSTLQIKLSLGDRQ